MLYLDPLWSSRVFSDSCAHLYGAARLTDTFPGGSAAADQAPLGVRAGDALHLAVCAERHATLCTLDRRLGEAAAPLGVAAELL